MPPKFRGGRGGGGGDAGGSMRGGRGGQSGGGGAWRGPPRGGGPPGANRGGRGQGRGGGQGGQRQPSQPPQVASPPAETSVTSTIAALENLSLAPTQQPLGVASPPQRTAQYIPEEIVDLPARPGYGKEGRPINLFTNHFRLSNIPNVRIYQYALTIPTKDGDAPTKGFATAIWESAEVIAALGQYYASMIFNGRAIAWSTQRIHNIPTIEVPRGKTTVRVNFTYATEFDLTDLTQYIAKQKPNSPEIFQCLTFLNQVIADSLTKSPRFRAVGRKYFPADDDEREIFRVDDYSLLEFRRGFYQAVHWGGSKGLTINVNVTTGIFWNSQMHTIVDLALRSIGRRADEGMALATMNENQFRIVSRNMRGLKFYIKYRGGTKEKQVHIATSLSKETARGKRFDVQEENTSVMDYFLKTYNVRLKFPDAPLVKKGDNFFPMELCHIIPKLDGIQAAAMIKFASKPPDIRKKEIEFKVRNLNWQNDATLKRFGMTISQQMSSVPARILQHPRLSGGTDMGGGGMFEPRSGKWDLRGYRLKQSVSLKRWGILIFDDQRKFSGPQGALGRFLDTFLLSATDYGMLIDRSPVVTYGNFNAPLPAVNRSCDELYTRITKEKGGPPELLMFFIKGKSPIMYENIKSFCDTIRGVPSQAVDSFNAMKKGGDRAFHANLLLKVNSKLGGTTVTLSNPLTTASVPTMFIGADVSHAAPGSRAPSLATMVGSVDHEGVKYACPLPLNQSNREESILGVRSMVTEIVNLYKKNTNTFPQRVMYFRDGVAEGQFAKVKELEVTAIKEAVTRLSGRTPSVTAIVVRKRNHTRLFPRDGEGDRSSRGNVYPGTVVDQDITHPTDFDFYVIHDDHKLPADFVQRLCYHMSYVYQRSSGAVSLHPAVYYAHLAGNRARAHDPSRDRDDDSSGSGVMQSGRPPVDANVVPLRPIHANIQGSMWWM